MIDTNRQAVVAELRGNRVAPRFRARERGATPSRVVGLFPPGTGPALHRHPYEETFVVEEGTATLVIDGKTALVRAGQAVAVPAGAAHGFANSGHGILRQVSIHPSDRMIQERIAG